MAILLSLNIKAKLLKGVKAMLTINNQNRSGDQGGGQRTGGNQGDMGRTDQGNTNE